MFVCPIFFIPSIDAAVRTTYYKYHHPKEVLVTNGVLNRELDRVAGKAVSNIAEDKAGPQYVGLRAPIREGEREIDR